MRRHLAAPQGSHEGVLLHHWRRVPGEVLDGSAPAGVITVLSEGDSDGDPYSHFGRRGPGPGDTGTDHPRRRAKELSEGIIRLLANRQRGIRHKASHGPFHRPIGQTVIATGNRGGDATHGWLRIVQQRPEEGGLLCWLSKALMKLKELADDLKGGSPMQRLLRILCFPGARVCETV